MVVVCLNASGELHEYVSLLYTTYTEGTLKGQFMSLLLSELSYNFDLQDDSACGVTIWLLLQSKNVELRNVISFISGLAKTDTVVIERWW